jgi:hypothetical protein
LAKTSRAAERKAKKAAKLAAKKGERPEMLEADNSSSEAALLRAGDDLTALQAGREAAKGKGRGRKRRQSNTKAANEDEAANDGDLDLAPIKMKAGGKKKAKKGKRGKRESEALVEDELPDAKSDVEPMCSSDYDEI